MEECTSLNPYKGWWTPLTNNQKREISMVEAPDIIIPTCKTEIQIAAMMVDLQGYCLENKVIATFLPASAAVNRNAGLKKATSKIVIMVDDDISGFWDGWWQELIRPLEMPNCVYVSARLMRPDGRPGAMMFEGDRNPPLTIVPRAPTACVALITSPFGARRRRDDARQL
jgi:hypothetical protein